MTPTEQAYVELQQASRELSAKAAAFLATTDDDRQARFVAGLCAGLNGILLDTGGWATTLQPAYRALAAVLRERLPGAEAKLRIATN